MSTNPIGVLPQAHNDLLAAAAERVISLAGGQTPLAEKLTALTGKRVRQSRISMWLFRGCIPPKWVIPCEAALAGEMKRYDIRPDLYPRDHAA